MEFRAEPFDAETHHEMLAGWWEAQAWPVLPPDLLPKTGFVMHGADSAAYCAGFLYRTDSKWALLEFVVGNPAVDKLVRAEAVRALIGKLLERAWAEGFTRVFSTVDPSKNRRLAQTYIDTGFLVTEVATQGMWRAEECQH